MFKNIKVGDDVVRNLGGAQMKLKVSAVTEDEIVCGPWKFSRNNGAEIDEELGWNERKTGSYLINREEE